MNIKYRDQSGGTLICIPRFKKIRYDLEILKTLREPVTLYDIFTRIHYPESSVHLILREYLRKGIIRIVKEEPMRVKRYTKKYYQLTEAGYLLLKLATTIHDP